MTMITRAICIVLMALFSSGLYSAESRTCVDASTDDLARLSWDKMVADSNAETQEKLHAALFELVGAELEKRYVTSSLQFHMALSEPSIVMVKDELSGLCAEQIIALAQKVSANPHMP
jgi:hypothetical protein